MKKTLLLSLILFSLQTYAKCRLPAGQKLTVGCTYDCDGAMTFRLKSAARRLGYDIHVTQLQPSAEISQVLAGVDAVLIPGGADIHPKYYLPSVTPELREYTLRNLHLAKLTEEGKQRDAFEYDLARKFATDPTLTKFPLLGICRGMQMMTVAQGIPLYLDIKAELGIPNRWYKFDRVSVTAPNSLIDQLYRWSSFYAFELHHQGLRVDYYNEHREQYPDVRVSAYSNKGLIAEAIEYVDRTALGVQYHPELSFSTAAFPVFKWFLTKACEYKTSASKDHP